MILLIFFILQMPYWSIAVSLNKNSLSDCKIIISILCEECYNIQLSIEIQMSQITSNLQLSEQSANKPPKTKEQYSRNVKKLKVKLKKVTTEIEALEQKIRIFQNTSNDKMLALKISKFCRQRKLTPEMLYRFADRNNTKNINKQILHDTLKSIGLKLSQNQYKRLEYLLDEDLSGQISWDEYNHFLYAFGVKSQYSANDKYLKDAFDKFDINKLLGIAEEEKKKKKGDASYRQLLNYEQFLKYCHRHFPELKEKDIISIFRLLQKNQMIDLEDFLNYIKRKQEDQKKLRDKNKKKDKDKVKDSKQDESKTLKGIIKALFKERARDRKLLFHASEFQRLEKILEKQRSSLVTLFRQIDQKKRGSFGFDQLIQYFTKHCLKPNMIYTYEIMGRKAYLSKQKPEDVLRQYNNSSDSIDKKLFLKYCNGEYKLNEKEAEEVWISLAKQENKLPIRLIIDAMKLEEGQKKIVYIKPSLWDTKPKDFFKKGTYTMFFNPLVALRGCISIMEELNKEKQHFWDDFEFGPTFEDPSGIYSIGMDISEASTKWITVNSLQMDDFYFPTADKIYQSSPICTHEMFPKALTLLTTQSEQFLFNRKKIDFNVKKVTEQDLNPLFEGLYPLIFHSFAKYGIYVFRFFVKEKWAYVLIDNKIPCNNEGQPLFSMSASKRLNWISLIQKAYAKIKGSYQRLFQPGTIQHYIYELSRSLPVEQEIQKMLKSEQQKNSLWETIFNNSNSEPKQNIFSITTDSAVTQLTQNNVETGFIKNFLYKIGGAIQLPDKKCSNSHKSHRLIFFKSLKLKNEDLWNLSWHIGEQKNKFDEFETLIQSQLRQKKTSISVVTDKQCTILNYKLFRSIFNKLFYFKKASFDNMIILRKIVQFEEKFVCKYEISSSEKKQNRKLQFLVSLMKIKSPDDTNVQIKLKNSKGQVVEQRELKNLYGNMEFTVDSKMHHLEFSIGNWTKGQDHVYSLTLYILNPRYHLRELDRQILFRHVSPYQEACHLDIEKCGDKQRKYIYRNFFKAADRGGVCCC